MRIFKTRWFDKWAAEEGVIDSVLKAAINEISRGLVEASLGSHVYKKRIRLLERGKRGGARTLVAYHAQSKAFFIYGYAKNEKADINERELQAVKLLAAKLLELKEGALLNALKQNELKEVK